MTLIIGLTGSIGMGKSTTARMFQSCGIPVHDADAAVHDLYAGEAAALIEAAFPGSVRDGVVDRAALGRLVLGHADKVRQLEAIVHPLVRRREEDAIAAARAAGQRALVLDIPLLFETGAEKRCDCVVVVSAPAAVQRARVMARPGMTEERFAAILARQMPDEEKRRRADFVVDSSLGLESAQAQVCDILQALSARSGSATAMRGA
jgi:dephospho-CoA kinase